MIMRKTSGMLGMSFLVLLSGCETITSTPLNTIPAADDPPVVIADGGHQPSAPLPSPVACADSSSFECPGDPGGKVGALDRGALPRATANRPSLAPGLTYYLPRQLVKLTATRTEPKAKTLLAAQNEAVAAATAATAMRKRIEADIAATKKTIVEVADNKTVVELLMKDLSKLEAGLAEAVKAEADAKTDAVNKTNAMIAHNPSAPAGTGTNTALVLELLPMAPDPAYAFRLDPKHSWMSDDKHKISLTTNGLLTSTDIVAADRTADILAEIAVLAGYAVGRGLPGVKSNAPESREAARNACTGSPDKVVAIVDLANPQEIQRFNHDVQCMGIRIALASERASFPTGIPSGDIPKVSGIFYRPVVDVGLRVSYCGTAACLDDENGWFLKDTLNVPLPQFGAISPVPQNAGFMTRTAYKNTFKDGVLIIYDADRPSEALELARTPVRLVDGLFTGISKVISLRTGANADRVSLSASELATFSALAGDAEKLRLYQKCAADKRSADEPLLPCLDLLK